VKASGLRLSAFRTRIQPPSFSLVVGYRWQACRDVNDWKKTRWSLFGYLPTRNRLLKATGMRVCPSRDTWCEHVPTYLRVGVDWVTIRTSKIWGSLTPIGLIFAVSINHHRAQSGTTVQPSCPGWSSSCCPRSSGFVNLAPGQKKPPNRAAIQNCSNAPVAANERSHAAQPI